jgi:hypothetical protein
MKLKRALCLLSMLLAATAISSATTTLVTLVASGVNANYCPNCTGVQNLLPLSNITGLVSPVSLPLAAGTYIITNAAPSGTYEAWNYDTNTSPTWNWSFGAATAAGVVLLDDYVGTNVAGTLKGFTSADLAAQATLGSSTGIYAYDGLTRLSATSTALFSDSFYLPTATTVNFFIPDSFIGDNLGGIQLYVTSQPTGTPEPAISLLIGTGLAALGLYRRKRQSRVG